MRSLALVIASFGATILCWGTYVPMLQWGQLAMSTAATGAPARWRPFVCVGLAYFLIGVIVPAVLLRTKGEKGDWTYSGVVMSLAAGVLGALGALGIILAINFGGNPLYVAPLVFGLAPVVNSFLTIYLAKRMSEIGPFFLAGLLMVLLGAVTVLLSAPHKGHAPAAKVAAKADATDVSVAPPMGGDAAARAEARVERAAASPPAATKAANSVARWFLQIASILMVGLCWGAYGPTLHKGQAAMMNSRLRPLVCVGLAYFAIAVVIPNFVLAEFPEASTYASRGFFWAFLAGSAGAVGALGIIMAFNFGGKPIYVMPLIFGGAPVVATLVSAITSGQMSQMGGLQLAFFIAGLMLVIAGAAIVLVFAPKGSPPPKAVEPAPAPPTPEPVETATPA